MTWLQQENEGIGENQIMAWMMYDGLPARWYNFG